MHRIIAKPTKNGDEVSWAESAAAHHHGPRHIPVVPAGRRFGNGPEHGVSANVHGRRGHIGR